MRGLVITQSNELPNPDIIARHRFDLKGKEISYALMEIDHPAFDPVRHADYVLVQKKAFSLNYRDISIATYIQSRLNMVKPDTRSYYAIGSEFSGIVVKLGNNVRGLKMGDRVIGNGEYPFTKDKNVPAGLPTNEGSKEFEILPAVKLLVIPDGMSFEVGAAFSIGAQTTYAMIDRLAIGSGSRVLVTAGTSNTSLFALQSLCKRDDISVSTIVRNVAARENLLSLGWRLDKIFVAKDETSSFVVHPEIREYVTQGGLFKYVIDPFMDSYLSRVISIMGINSKYISCGITNQVEIPQVSFSVALFAEIIMKNISIEGNCLGSTQHLQQALDDYEKGTYDVLLNNVIENDIQSFFQRSFGSKEGLGKVVYKY